MRNASRLGIYYFFHDERNLPFHYLTPARWTSQVPPPYETTMQPETYLAFALDDLREESSRALVNAFGNAKRALHFTIDLLLHQYGLFLHHRKSNFPSKLKLLDEIGLLPIALMRNLNVDRNLLEHEYALPSRSRVEEAVDVARLILLAMEKFTERVPNEMVVGWREPRIHSVMRIDPMTGKLALHKLRAPGRYRRSHGISHFAGPLRSIRGKLSKGIDVAKEPWKTIPIQPKHKSVWLPIVSLFVRLQREKAMHSTRVDGEGRAITMGITLPMPEVGTSAWNDFIDDALEERAQQERRQGTSKKVKKK